MFLALLAARTPLFWYVNHLAPIRKGTEPATFRLAAQYLSQLRHRVPCHMGNAGPEMLSEATLAIGFQ
jgi:hypothetical protein